MDTEVKECNVYSSDVCDGNGFLSMYEVRFCSFEAYLVRFGRKKDGIGIVTINRDIYNILDGAGCS